VFRTDPDLYPSFYLNEEPDLGPDPGSQSNADPDPDLGQTFRQKNLDFHIKKNIPTDVGTQSHFERLEIRFIY
jgi:hypothetical protein